MESDEKRDFAKKLDRLVSLVAIGLVDGRPVSEQVRLLSSAGYAPKEIADVVGTTANSVRVQLHAIRKVRNKPSRSTDPK
jgi:hypothetical protein